MWNKFHTADLKRPESLRAILRRSDLSETLLDDAGNTGFADSFFRWTASRVEMQHSIVRLTVCRARLAQGRGFGRRLTGPTGLLQRGLRHARFRFAFDAAIPNFLFGSQPVFKMVAVFTSAREVFPVRQFADTFQFLIRQLICVSHMRILLSMNGHQETLLQLAVCAARF